MNTAQLLRKAVSITALPLLLALSASTQVGCLGHAGPSEVAQGQRYESGDPTYDQFFQSVHELSVQMATAPKAESQLRMALAKELGVEPEEEDEPQAAPAAPAAAAPASAPSAPSPTDAYEAQLKQSAINAIPGAATVNAVSAQVDQAKATVGQFKALFGGGATQAPEPAKPAAAKVKKEPKAPSPSLIAGALKSRSKKLGVEMKLTVDRQALDAGDAKAAMQTAGDSEEGKKLARLVEETAKGELELVIKMQAAKKKLEKLASLGAALDGNAETAFRKSRAKTNEVKKNLADAKALIELMESRASDVSKKASAMVDKLEQAAAAKLEEPAPKADTAVAQSDAKAPATAQAEAEPGKPAKAAGSPKAKAEEGAKPKAKRPPRAPTPKTAMADFEP